MLLIFAVLAIMSAAFLLLRYARRRSLPISHTHFNAFEPPAGARPLFEPSPAQLAHAAAAEVARERAKRARLSSAQLHSRIDRALKAWRASHSAQDTAELLAVAAASERGNDFSRAAQEITGVFRESGISGLTAVDLASLLESHISLLPSGVRSSGALFWLKQEVAELRSTRK